MAATKNDGNEPGRSDARVSRYAFWCRPLAGVSAVALAAYAPAYAGEFGPVLRTSDIDVQLAQTSGERTFDIPPGDLQSGLLAFSLSVDLQLLYSAELTTGLRTRGVRGRHTSDEALRRLLAGTGLRYRSAGPNTITLAQANSDDDGEFIELAPVVVEGVAEAPPPASDPLEGYKADFASTVTRTPLPIKETPSSIGVVTEDFIIDTGATDRAQALEQVSGVTRDTAVDGEAAINIRGFDLEDQIRLNGVTSFDGVPFDPALIERIEVPKGPSSIVSGASSPGGVLSIVTKQPQDTNFANLTQDFGSFGRMRTVVDVNGVLPDQEFVQGRLVATIAPDTGSFIDNTDTEEINVAPSLRLDTFDGDGTFILSTQYQRVNGVNSRGVPLLTSTGDAPAIDPTTNVGGGSSRGAFSDTERVATQIGYDHTFVDDLTLSIRGGYAYADLDNLDVYAFNPGGIPDTGDIALTASRTRGDTEIWSGEITLGKDLQLFGQNHNVIIGTDFVQQKNENFLAFSDITFDNIFDLQNNLDADDAEISTVLTDTLIETKQNGVFGQAIVRPSERLTLVFGARQDWARTESESRQVGQTIEVEQNEFTLRAGGSYEITPWVSVYAAYQESFLPQLNVREDGSAVPAETGNNVEVGAKFDGFDGRLGATLALFRTLRQNVATADPDNPGASIVTGEQRHQGVEFDVNGEPIPGLRLNAQVSFLDTEITDDRNNAVIGNQPPAVPASYQAGLFISYQFQEGHLQGLGFGGGALFHSGFVIDRENDFQTSSYERYDAAVFYQPVNWMRLSLNVRNLTDEVYIESPGTAASLNQFGAPRTFLGTFRLNF